MLQIANEPIIKWNELTLAQTRAKLSELVSNMIKEDASAEEIVKAIKDDYGYPYQPALHLGFAGHTFMGMVNYGNPNDAQFGELIKF